VIELVLRTREITMPTKKERIVEHLKGQIDAGVLRPGDPVPTSTELRAQFNVSVTPVREAIIELKLLGYLVGQPGVRVYVADHPPSPD
jgi:DNA-binding FadR family transcriptional regulator